MAIRGFKKGGSVKGVGNTPNPKTKGAIQPAGTAKRNFITSTPAHQKARKVSR